MKTYDPLTYRHPRTLDEAFNERGPVIDPNDPPMDWQDKLVLWGSLVAALVFIAGAVAGWLPGGGA